MCVVDVCTVNDSACSVLLKLLAWKFLQDMNIENDLNIPPDEEPVTKKISRLATQFFLPVLLPASSAFIGWLAHRKLSASLEQTKKDSEEVKSLSNEVHALKEELKFLEMRRQSLAVDSKQIVEEERVKLSSVSADLEKIREMLLDRQDMYCSVWKHHSIREDFEKNTLKPFSYSRSYDKDIGLHRGILDVLEHDRHCGMSRKDNGHLMWVYMDFWKARAELRMYKNVAKRLIDA